MTEIVTYAFHTNEWCTSVRAWHIMWLKYGTRYIYLCNPRLHLRFYGFGTWQLVEGKGTELCQSNQTHQQIPTTTPPPPRLAALRPAQSETKTLWLQTKELFTHTHTLVCKDLIVATVLPAETMITDGSRPISNNEINCSKARTPTVNNASFDPEQAVLFSRDLHLIFFALVGRGGKKRFF